MPIQDAQPVFVCGVPKSGTTLFMALLDGHKDLLVFPEQCAYLNFPIHGEVQKDDVLQSLFKEEKLPRFKNERVLGDRINKEKKDYSSIDYAYFSKSATDFYYDTLSHLKQEGDRDPKIALLALLHGFALASNHLSFQSWILKQTKYEFYLDKIFKDFPNARIIYLLRNPIESSLSRTIKKMKKKKLKEKNESVSEIRHSHLKIKAFYLEEWKKSVSAISVAQKEHASRVLIVRYEELTEHPEVVMHGVSEFLGITWTPSLLVPTFMGNPWQGNSMQGKKYTTIQKNESRSLPHSLQWQAQAILGRHLSKWGYADNHSATRRVDLRGLFSLLPGERLGPAIKYRVRKILSIQ